MYGEYMNIYDTYSEYVFIVIDFLAWWRHQMGIFSALLAIYAGNSPLTGEFLAQRPVTRNFDISFICAWMTPWVNNREAGDLRRHRAHYDVTVIMAIGSSYLYGF